MKGGRLHGTGGGEATFRGIPCGSLTKKRIEYLDIAKMISVLFVLADHIQYYIPVNHVFLITRVIWIAFFLQIFFIVTGVTGNYSAVSSKKDICNFAEKRFRALMIPYIIWCFFLNVSGNHAPSFFSGMLLGRMEDLEIAGINSVVWFLPVLFMANMVTVLVQNIICYFRKTIPGDLCNVIAAAVLIGIDRIINVIWGNYLFFGLRSAFLGAAFIFTGISVRKILQYVYTKFPMLKKFILSFILFAIGIPLAYWNMPVLYENDTIRYLYAVWMAKGYTGRNILIFFAASLCMSGGVIIFSMCLERVRLLAYCGKHSLLYMTEHIYTHDMIAAFALPVMERYMGNTGTGMKGMMLLIASVCLITITLPFIDRYMPFLYKPVS